jgi:phosphohistidine phosphatase SixA
VAPVAAIVNEGASAVEVVEEVIASPVAEVVETAAPVAEFVEEAAAEVVEEATPVAEVVEEVTPVAEIVEEVVTDDETPAVEGEGKEEA